MIELGDNRKLTAVKTKTLNKMWNLQHRGRLSALVKNCYVRAMSTKSNIRNVGIMAHIDAGKTTTTERMLYYSGYMRSVGEVHRGDTVMDYMSQERDRGITITSAAITFPWREHQINLIDTPGHIDFTVEVERAVRVLDGGIVVLDSSAGVEAQTLTVWRQADSHGVPRIAFLNKMDKPMASLDSCLDSMRRKLQVQPLLVQMPIGRGKDFVGMVDLVEMKALRWKADSSYDDWGKKYSVEELDVAEMREKALEARTLLIDSLCDHDETLSDLLLQRESYDAITSHELQQSLNKVTLADKANSVIVTLCGSAYKNIGVQPLMDAVTQYLPSPSEVSHPSLSYYDAGTFCGLAFKTINHPHKGLLTFVRVYNGSIQEGDEVHNMSKGTNERLGKLMVAFADDFRNVRAVTEGNIAVISGLKVTDTGDTLVTKASVAEAAIKRWTKVREEDEHESAPSPFLSGINVPSPVFYCSIEPASMRFQQPLESALAILSREDPSLTVSTDKDTGQTVLSGMGELHLEIIADRIKKEHKLDVDLGPLLISYKEMPLESVRKEVNFERQMLGQTHTVNMTLEVLPSKGVASPELKVAKNEAMKDVKWWQLKEIRRGVSNAASAGPLLGHPVIDCHFTLRSLTCSRGIPASLLSAAAQEATADVLKAAGTRLLEPLMRVEVSTEEELASAVAQDLMRRRGQVVETEDRGGLRAVEALVPLAELRGYSRHVRTMTSGRAFLAMELD